jgi:hypothetical protein
MTPQRSVTAETTNTQDQSTSRGTWWMVATEGLDHIDLHAAATTTLDQDGDGSGSGSSGDINMDYPGYYYNGGDPMADDNDEALILSTCNMNTNMNTNNKDNDGSITKIPVGLTMELVLDSSRSNVLNDVDDNLPSFDKLLRKLQVNIIRHVGDVLCTSSIHYMPSTSTPTRRLRSLLRRPNTNDNDNDNDNDNGPEVRSRSLQDSNTVITDTDTNTNNVLQFQVDELVGHSLVQIGKLSDLSSFSLYVCIYVCMYVFYH